MHEPVNELTLTGELVERELLRYTPAGIPILGAKLAHRGEVSEAGQRRRVEFDIGLSFAGPLAHGADGLCLGQAISASGFLAPRRRQSKTLVLHVTRFASHQPTPN